MKKALKILAICLIFFVFGLYALFLNFPKFINVDSYIEKAQKEIGLIFEFDELKIQPKYNFLVSVSFKNLNIKNLSGQSVANVSDFFADASIFQFKKIKLDNLKIDIPELDLAYLAPYLSKKDENLKNIKGKISCNLYSENGDIVGEIQLKNFSIINNAYDIKSYENIKILPNLSFERRKIKINSILIKSKKININLKGEIVDYLKKNPQIDIQAELKNTSADRIIYLLPNLIETPDDSIRKIKKYGADAILNGTVRIFGDAILPKITGKIDIKNIVVLRGKFKIRPSYGFVEFLEDKLRVSIRAYAYKDEYVDIDGIATIEVEPKGEFTIKSTKNVDLELAQDILLPVRDIVGFILGPVPMLDVNKGVGSIDLYVKGTKTFGILNGYFEFRNASATLNGLKTYLTDGVGKITFKEYDIFYDGIIAKLKNGDVKIGGKANVDGNCFMTIGVKNLDNFDYKKMILENSKIEPKTIDFIDKLKIKNNADFSFKTKFEPNFKEINLSKLNLKGVVNFENVENSPLKHKMGKIILENNKIRSENLGFSLFGANAKLILNLAKIMNIEFSDTMRNYNKNPEIKGSVSIEQAELENFTQEIQKYFSSNKYFSSFSDFSGHINSNINFDNLNLNGLVGFDNVSFMDKKNNTKIKLNSGVLRIENNNLKLDALNLDYGEIPLFFSAKINNIKEKNPFFDSRFSMSLKSVDVDKYINKNLTSPIKLRGEVLLKGILKGRADNYNLFATLVLPKESDISYLGANFGDDHLKREAKLSLNLVKNLANINNFEYLKYITSQNNKTTAVPALKVIGKVYLKDKIANFENLKIKTYLPTSTRIFNILFKKSILKQGQFESDIVVNGPQNSPKILGKLAFSDINIPLYNLKVKDVNLNFADEYINGNLKGSGFDSDVEITAKILNKMALPIVFKEIDIASENINISKIIDAMSSLNKIQTSTNFINTKNEIVLKPDDVIIEKGSASAKNVNLYNIVANNLKMNFSAKENDFKFSDTIFDIAQGQIKASGDFDFKTTKINVLADVVNCSANDLVKSFLGVKDQIYGVMNGSIYFSGSNLDSPEGIKTIQSKATFNVRNGKMPKLGSLEYLIRAGNIYKSGILGLTLNNIIEVLIPYKTGEFEDIKGELLIEKGNVENIEIFTMGENLSLYILGKYNILDSHADIKVMGRLAKKVSNMLGPIGNASFNSVINFLSGARKDKTSENELIKNINKIPLIEISGDDFRIFEATIFGDLNKDDYVKTFNWLN